ncbi:hypothetical protein GUJ93_ZPchr0001g32393 [Zizania palustris]|uniref:F-box domain-containing protein n=1 Tax=Zizania palustris TaxID=103762 RepID=A0A8J5VU47_ZIZPA|nr:hypothetical protein GUJ93_ZPchr0001g32393 [Zizania palustris]
MGDGVESFAAMCFYGDVLESVLERVPTADLAATARVSREWLRAVRAAVRRRPRRLPWLVVHLLQGGKRRTAAFDPHSGAWVTVPAARHDTPTPVRLLRGAGGDRVCVLSLSGLTVAGDPLGKDEGVVLKAPGVWRVDPVFAAVGDRVVVLGGACQLALAEGEDASAVEVYDHESGRWTLCGPMPAALRESAAATWLSAAATDQRVYLTDRTTGCASWFDPAKLQWGPTCRLRPDAAVSSWALAPGRAGAEQLVLFGAKHGAEQAANRIIIQAWQVDGDALALSPGAAHDTMPSEMSQRLFPHDEDEEDYEEISPSIGVCGHAAGGYVYNAAEPANGAVLYELRDGEDSAVQRWAWVPCAPAVEAEPLGRVILACSPVGLDELAREPQKRPLGPQP